MMKNLQDKAAKDPLFIAASERVQNLWNDVEERLSASQYLAGDECSAADFLLAVIANWGGYLPHAPAFGENTKRVLKNISSRPSYQKALAAEKVEYKAA
jgi:glutathione S-transferase